MRPDARQLPERRKSAALERVSSVRRKERSKSKKTRRPVVRLTAERLRYRFAKPTEAKRQGPDKPERRRRWKLPSPCDQRAGRWSDSRGLQCCRTRSRRAGPDFRNERKTALPAPIRIRPPPIAPESATGRVTMAGTE